MQLTPVGEKFIALVPGEPGLAEGGAVGAVRKWELLDLLIQPRSFARQRSGARVALQRCSTFLNALVYIGSGAHKIQHKILPALILANN